jgi:hypothetical protein
VEGITFVLQEDESIRFEVIPLVVGVRNRAIKENNNQPYVMSMMLT